MTRGGKHAPRVSIPFSQKAVLFMLYSLYDVLTGKNSGHLERRESVGAAERVNEIIHNLSHLLNSRQGSIPHLPDYGLPDLGSIYRGMPDSIEDLRTHVQDAVAKYEPRLSRVRARPQFSEGDETKLYLLLSAELDGERIRFRTSFSSDQHVEVEQFVRPV